MIEQLVDIYLTQEAHHKFKLTREEAYEYFLHSLSHNCMIIAQDEITHEITGFIEFWRLSFEELGRYICNEKINMFETKQEGPVCYVFDLWVNPKFRNGLTPRLLREAGYRQNEDAEYFAYHIRGSASKKLPRINVMTNEQTRKVWVKEVL